MTNSGMTLLRRREVRLEGGIKDSGPGETKMADSVPKSPFTAPLPGLQAPLQDADPRAEQLRVLPA